MTGKKDKPGLFLRIKHNLIRFISFWRGPIAKFSRLKRKRTTGRILWVLLTPVLVGIVTFSVLLGSWWLLLDRPALRAAAQTPIDAILVLGGSIRREIYVAELAKEFPQVPILISSGSLEPCIWLIFEQAKAPMQQVWVQNCATSTFKNYYFAVPLLKKWGVHHLKIITSATHVPRAKWLGQIILASHNILGEIDLVTEQGVPGNTESWVKTALDVTRSLVWARVSQYYSPECSALKHLPDVNFSAWKHRKFKCEHQGKLPDNSR